MNLGQRALSGLTISLLVLAIGLGCFNVFLKYSSPQYYEVICGTPLAFTWKPPVLIKNYKTDDTFLTVTFVDGAVASHIWQANETCYIIPTKKNNYEPIQSSFAPRHLPSRRGNGVRLFRHTA